MRRSWSLAGFAAVLVLLAAPAQAQNDPISGFFKFMFGGPQHQQPVQPEQQRPQQSRPRRSEPVEKQVVISPKDPDAQAILVVGDDQAEGLALGLDVAFADTKSILVVNKSRSDAGLVRDLPFELSAKLPALLAERKYDFVVVMIGENDRVTFPSAATGGKQEEVRSEKWETLYRERVKKVAGLLKDYGKPFYWVSLPPMERPSLSAFASYLNGIYKSGVEQAGGLSIDSWNGFVDEDGHFTSQGPDIDGQQKRLRSSDGMHFTRAGQRKLAYYVETEIRKVMHGETVKLEPAMPEVLPVQPDAQKALLAAPPPLPAAPWAKIGPVIPMSTEADADTDLAGAPQSKTQPKPSEKGVVDALPGGYPLAETPLYRRLIAGEPIPAPSGRIDDFTWRR